METLFGRVLRRHAMNGHAAAAMAMPGREIA